MAFRMICPNCQGKNKIVKKCWNCGKYACSECTVGKLCIDCYMKIKAKKEVEDYNTDKYSKENEVMADLILQTT